MRKWVALLLVVILVLGLTACGGDKGEPAKAGAPAAGIVGSWTYGNGSDLGYEFHPDGTGAYRFSNGVNKFTYKDLGDTVAISFQGDRLANHWRYRVEGNVLTIENIFGKSVQYARK